MADIKLQSWVEHTKQLADISDVKKSCKLLITFAISIGRCDEQFIRELVIPYVNFHALKLRTDSEAELRGDGDYEDAKMDVLDSIEEYMLDEDYQFVDILLGS